MVKELFKPAKTVKRNVTPPTTQFFRSTGDRDKHFFKPATLTGSNTKSNANPIQKKEESLPRDIQMNMGHALGENLSDVRIHKDSENSTAIGALAYTQGNDIHFAPGKFQPNTEQGQKLIGHELTHVKQQRQGRVKPSAQAKGIPLNNDKSLENEADNMGAMIAKRNLSSSPGISGKEPIATNKTSDTFPLQRQEDPVQRDGGTTVAAAALAYQITSEVLSSASGPSDIDLIVDEMVGMHYGRHATAAGRAKSTGVTTRKSHVFSYLAESFLLRSNLIELKIRMDYEADDNGVGNISFAIEKIDDAAGYGGRFNVNLTPMESSTFGAVRLTVGFDVGGLGSRGSGSFTYTIYPFGISKIREIGDTGNYLGMQDSHSEG